MKTSNSDMDFFTSLPKATKAFNESKVPCTLLQGQDHYEDDFFIDRAKDAVEHWPKLYRVLDEK
jgi:hypothetical protein